MWGIRVVILVVVFISLHAPVYAADISVSASVPLSEQYKKQIQDSSTITIQRKNRIIYISGTILDGAGPVEGQNYDLLIVSDIGKIEVRKRDVTPVSGSFSHVFIPERSRSYTVFLLNTTYAQPFLVSSTQL